MTMTMVHVAYMITRPGYEPGTTTVVLGNDLGGGAPTTEDDIPQIIALAKGVIGDQLRADEVVVLAKATI
jgi:hypothetical protein